MRSRVLCASVAAVLLITGCTSGSGANSKTSALPTPLPTSVAGDGLVCGIVPRVTVATALGRTDFSASGGVVPAASRNPDGTQFASARCQVTVSRGGESPALDFTIRRVAVTDLDIVRGARKHAYEYTYPSDVGIGFAFRESYHDAAGKSYRSGESGMIRGDWTITMGIQAPADGRDAMTDAIALMNLVVSALKIPLQPSKPYPSEFATAAR